MIFLISNFDIDHCNGLLTGIFLYQKIMKKIILAFDGTHFSDGAFEFARKINDLNQVLLTGIFLPQAEFANLWSYGDAMTAPLFIPLIENNEDEKLEKNITRFEEQCQKQGIEYRIHKDFYDFALQELKNESRFADLLIIGSDSFFDTMGTKISSDHLDETLHGIECPVVVVPENFKFPEINILSYDGSESSVYAIKQFAYLFPEMSENPTYLVYANEHSNIEIPNEVNIEDLTARHFPNLTLTKLDIEPGNKFSEWISAEESAILISGSYGRSLISRIFKKSFISGIIKDHKLPVFVAHK